MNNRAKGNRAEKEYVTLLESEGYLTYRVKGSYVWNNEVDIFGLFDILAINKNNIDFFQIKSNDTAGSIKKIRMWINKNKNNLPSNSNFYVCVRKDNKHHSNRWNIIRC